jgi:methionyl-tRNA formyltransferase
MKKHILIIIDNIFQYERLKSLFEKKSRADLKVDFRHSKIKSAIWDHPDFAGRNKMLVVKQEIDFITTTYDLVISVHCFQYFPKELVENVRCINVHPGYNPINRGWYPQVFAIVHDLQIGATIHEMDEKLDHGPIIVRKFVETHSWDTSLTIYKRVLEAEIELFETYFEKIIDHSYKKIIPETKGNMFQKADFKALCELDLNRQGTFKEFYDLLRALSHGDHKNAFFVDKKTNQKIYLKLEISKEE